MTGQAIRRGEVWWVRFAGGVGSEIRKTRPAIVVSNNRSNELLARVQVIPMTTNVARVYPGEALIVLDGQSRKAMANQIQTVDRSRCISRAGTVGSDGMRDVEKAIAFQLALPRER